MINCTQYTHLLQKFAKSKSRLIKKMLNQKVPESTINDKLRSAYPLTTYNLTPGRGLNKHVNKTE